MKFLKKVSAALKDQNSIYLAKLAKRTDFRNPELETAVIKATSHDESRVDYKNSKRIFSWIKTAPSFLKPAIWAITTRVEKTGNWVVALKSLMLMHGIFCCKIPSVQKIGRLPFDLSNFIDVRSSSTSCYSSFVRAYFAFLDQKSVFQAQEEEINGKDRNVIRLLEFLRKLQVLLDMLLQMRPYGPGRKATVILEAMDCILIEVFDIYSRICNGIAEALVKIYRVNRAEAILALGVLNKATSQGGELQHYFEFCRDIGVLNASELPRVEQIPEDDIRDLERIIGNVKDKNVSVVDMSNIIEKDSQTIVAQREDSRNSLTTIITSNWVEFEDDFSIITEGDSVFSTNTLDSCTNPFVDPQNVPPLFHNYSYEHANTKGGFLPLEEYSYESLRRTFVQ